ncbi:hypothetical protein FNV43_RR08235 [Rhamnella rubrinervis]|uniref:Uncharacterized protein n=1 Tax=Rhamnella rubrinervis TaxID=2594499 RepID=A0A8K0MNG7_9ROSA|nr:hypothetical protein FNV43_RR08235 [Rhamnella rubrinervis]
MLYLRVNLGAIVTEGASRLERDHLWLECDSTYFTNLLHSPKVVVSKPTKEDGRTTTTCSKDSFSSFLHIFVEGNIVMDALWKLLFLLCAVMIHHCWTPGLIANMSCVRFDAIAHGFDWSRTPLPVCAEFKYLVTGSTS